jgi:hypothetical protein
MTDERVPSLVVEKRQRRHHQPRRVMGDQMREAGLGEHGLGFDVG